MNFLELLLVTRKMSFEDGSVSYYGQKVLIFPSPSIIQYVNQIGYTIEDGKELYSMAKESMLEYKDKIMTAYRSSKSPTWLLDTINLYGLGKLYYENPGESSTGTLVLENSPFAGVHKANASDPIDHIARGILAGITSAIFEKNFDVIETECTNSQNGKCKFILDSKESLMNKYASVYKLQIGD